MIGVQSLAERSCLHWFHGIFPIIRGRGTDLRLPARATARAWLLQIEKIRFMD